MVHCTIFQTIFRNQYVINLSNMVRWMDSIYGILVWLWASLRMLIFSCFHIFLTIREIARNNWVKTLNVTVRGSGNTDTTEIKQDSYAVDNRDSQSLNSNMVCSITEREPGTRPWLYVGKSKQNILKNNLMVLSSSSNQLSNTNLIKF